MLVINTFIALQQHFNNIAAISFHNIAWPHGRVATWLNRFNVAATLLEISTGWLPIFFSIAAALNKTISEVFALEVQGHACPIKPVYCLKTASFVMGSAPFYHHWSQFQSPAAVYNYQ